MDTIDLTATEQAVLLAMPDFEYMSDAPMSEGGAWGATLTRDILSAGLANTQHGASAILSSLVQKGILAERSEYRTRADGGWFDVTDAGYETWVHLSAAAKNDNTVDHNTTGRIALD